jgi:hypothetical protein
MKLTKIYIQHVSGRKSIGLQPHRKSLPVLLLKANCLCDTNEGRSTMYSLRQELPCIMCLVKVKLFKFRLNILIKLSITMKPNTCNMKIYFMTILMMVILYYKY